MLRCNSIETLAVSQVQSVGTGERLKGRCTSLSRPSVFSQDSLPLADRHPSNEERGALEFKTDKRSFLPFCLPT